MAKWLDQKYWVGSAPLRCDICDRSITDKFIDGRTSMGPWANMCPRCFKACGTGLGVGKGQQYEYQVENSQRFKWLKTKG